jgi:hypothetical protein
MGGAAALLLELEKRINEIPINSSELGFTRPGPYIYEFLADIKITYETVTMLIDTIDQATGLLEDGKLNVDPSCFWYTYVALGPCLETVLLIPIRC